MVSAGKATLHECDTIYSVGDVYMMLEIVAVDAHNRARVMEWERAKADRH